MVLTGFFSRGHTLLGRGERVFDTFFFSNKIVKIPFCTLTPLFHFFSFFWVFLGFFLNFLSTTPGFALCCYFIAKLPFPTALPPTHPLWVENPQGVGGGGCGGVGGVEAPAGANRQPPHACHPRCEGDMRAELGRGRVGGVRGALNLGLNGV